MYKKFAQFYDYIPLNSFTHIIMEFIHANQIPVQKVLDLGCGTGSFLLELVKEGITGTGIDISKDMIAVARAKAEKSAAREMVEFQVASIVDFNLNQTYDLVTSNLDTINHLLTEEEVRRTFLNARRHLNDHGIFYFDLHTATGLRSWVYQANIHNENLVRFLHGTFNEEIQIGTLHIEAFLRVNPRVPIYIRHIETVHEKAYPLSSILAWLGDAGFTETKPIGPDSGLSVEEMETRGRCFLCAVK